MITLTKRLKAEAAERESNAGSGNKPASAPAATSRKRVSIRDQLLVQEVQEMEQGLPPGSKVNQIAIRVIY